MGAETHWGRPAEADPFAPGQLIRRGWRLYRAAARQLVTVAAVPEAIRIALLLPSLGVVAEAVEGIVGVFVDFTARVAANPAAYQGANAARLEAQFQADLQAQLQALLVPTPEGALWLAVSAGLGGAAGLVSTSALVAAASSLAEGRPVSPGGAFRWVARRSGLIGPIAALGLGWIVVTWLPLLLQGSPEFQAWAGAPGSPRANLLASLLAILAVAVTIGIVILAVRWALYIPAVLVENLGVGRGLQRAATLTRGVRVRLSLAMAGVLLLHAITVGFVAAVVGLMLGVTFVSVTAGAAAYLVAAFIGDLLWAPLLPAILALAYRDRVGVDTGAILDGD